MALSVIVVIGGEYASAFYFTVWSPFRHRFTLAILGRLWMWLDYEIS